MPNIKTFAAIIILAFVIIVTLESKLHQQHQANQGNDFPAQMETVDYN